MKNGSYYGIDFGTTNTSVFMFNYDSGRGAITARYGTDGKDLYPFSSCVAIPRSESGGGNRYGREVRENINKYADDYEIVTSFKSLLGTDNKVYAGGRPHSGEELATMFLRHVKETVTKIRPDFGEAVFSIPVDFSAQARSELMRAAHHAGIEVKGFISESTSAYIAKVREIKAYSRVLVVDFGGGTLDLSVLSLKDRRVSEEAVYGVKFGGDDIDRELALRLAPMVYHERSFEELGPAEKDRLLNEVERMKINFTNYDDYTVTLGRGSSPVTVYYDTFSAIVTPLITENTRDAILKVMMKAGVGPENIDAVILAGGSSGLRPFRDIILSLFERDKVIFDSEANKYQWMAAKGAAVASALGCEFRLSDDICLLLSDGDTFRILKKDENKVGDSSETITLSLTDDATDAHFIITDSSGKNKYTTFSVKAKGYLNEKLYLSMSVGVDQIAVVTVKNDNIYNGYNECEKINKLRFYYDLGEIEDMI